MAELFPLVLASAFFLSLGFANRVRNNSLADFIPVQRHGHTQIADAADFSSSTVAATVSLATIIAAYFNLASFFGLWLLWTAITGALGMLLVYLFSKKIAAKLSSYQRIPTIHGFLASEYSNRRMQAMTATLTSVGLLLLLATELIVGSEFLGSVAPSLPPQALSVGLTITVVAYVLLGGFRTVLLTDRIQMRIIWLAIPLLLLGIWTAASQQPQAVVARIADAQKFAPIDNGLRWFLFGILAMNIPTHLSSMTVWQRVGACATPQTLNLGLLRSAVGILFSWGALVVVAWLATVLFSGQSGAQSFSSLIEALNETLFGRLLVMMILLGMYCALLSTASTLLISIGHMIYCDIYRPDQTTQEVGLTRVRLVIVISAAFALGMVSALRLMGFQVEDLIFSIYGGALALFPPLVACLLAEKPTLKAISKAAYVAAFVGCIGGWVSAGYAKLMGAQTIVFLSPAIGMGISATILTVALAATQLPSTASKN